MSWREIYLSEICDVQLGKTPERRNKIFWDSSKSTDNVWVSISDMRHGEEIFDSKEYVSNDALPLFKITPKGTLMLSFKLTLGKVSFAGKDLLTNEAIASLVNLSDTVNKHFLYYYFSFYDWNKATEGDQKVKGRTLNKKKLHQIKVPIPLLQEQKQIVETLDKAFEKIDKAIANIERNIQNAEELFKSKVKELFDFTLAQSNPKTLSEISENLDKKRVPISKNKRKSGNVPYYGASGVVDYVEDYLFDESLLLISEDGANLLARTYPIAFSISGKSWVNNHAHVLRFDSEISQMFVEHYFNSINLEPYVSGMAQPKLNQKQLNSIKIPYPNVEKRKVIVNILNKAKQQTFDIRSKYLIKKVSLEELKKSILEKAFKGELTSVA